MLDEVSGMFEVYWEQFNQRIRRKNTKVDENKTLYSHPSQHNEETDKFSFIKSNLVFE